MAFNMETWMMKRFSVDKTNLKVSFNDCFHPEVPQPDSSNAYFPSDIEDPTVIQCDNFTALKLIADLYDIDLAVDDVASMDPTLSWLNTALSIEGMEDPSVRYIDNSRFIEAFECKGAIVKEAPQISIYTSKVETPFTIYPKTAKFISNLRQQVRGIFDLHLAESMAC